MFHNLKLGCWHVIGCEAIAAFSSLAFPAALGAVSFFSIFFFCDLDTLRHIHCLHFVYLG